MGDFSSISFLSTAAIVALLFSQIPKANSNGLNQSVIVVSFDGLGWEFVGSGRTKTPNFDIFASGGVKAKNLIGVHPVKTFPTHTTFMTGLYPESHGIVDNKFWDPLYMEKFILEHDCSNFDPKFYNQSEPIWLTMQKQGRKTGAYYWPGSTSYSEKPTFYAEPFCYIKCADYKGPTLEYLRLYLKVHCFFNWAKPFQKRIDTVLEWLTSENPPQLVMLYFEQPDIAGHKNGPNSPSYINKIEAVDREVVGYLIERLMRLQLMDKTNVILLSDHGMIETRHTRQIRIHDHVDPESYFKNIASRGHIWPKPGKLEEVYAKLKSAKNPHLRVYKKDEIPEELHWKNNRRIPPIYLVAEEGWLMRPDWNPLAEGEWVEGSHGWPPTENSAGIFYARGPAFKEGYKSTRTKRALDVYSLLCYLLGVKPLPNNGSLENMVEFLKYRPQSLRPDGSQAVTVSSNKAMTSIPIKPTPRITGQSKTVDGQRSTKGNQVRHVTETSKLSPVNLNEQLSAASRGMTTAVSMLVQPTKTSAMHALSTLQISENSQLSRVDKTDLTRVLSLSKGKYLRSKYALALKPTKYYRDINGSSVNHRTQSNPQKSVKVTAPTETMTTQLQQALTEKRSAKQVSDITLQSSSASSLGTSLPDMGSLETVRKFMQIEPEAKASKLVSSFQNNKTSTCCTITTLKMIQSTPAPDPKPTSTISTTITTESTKDSSLTPILSDVSLYLTTDGPSMRKATVPSPLLNHEKQPELTAETTTKTLHINDVQPTPIPLDTPLLTTNVQPDITALTKSPHISDVQATPSLADTSFTTQVRPINSFATATKFTDKNLQTNDYKPQLNVPTSLKRLIPNVTSVSKKSEIRSTTTKSFVDYKKIVDISKDVAGYLNSAADPTESSKIGLQTPATTRKEFTNTKPKVTIRLQEVPHLYTETSRKTVGNFQPSSRLLQQRLMTTVVAAHAIDKENSRKEKISLKSNLLIVSSMQVTSSVASSPEGLSKSNITANTGNNITSAMFNSSTTNETNDGLHPDVDTQALIDCLPYEKEGNEDIPGDLHEETNTNPLSRASVGTIPCIVITTFSILLQVTWLCGQ